jgi:hypothetical protein
MSLEGRLIGQDADARRPVLFVSAGNGDGIKIGAKQTSGWRRLLDLGNDRHLPVGGTGVALVRFEGGAEVTNRRREAP